MLFFFGEYSRRAIGFDFLNLTEPRIIIKMKYQKNDHKVYVSDRSGLIFINYGSFCTNGPDVLQ